MPTTPHHPEAHMHINFNPTCWLLGIAWTWEKADRALFIHTGPFCIGFHRHDYYEN